MKTIQFCTLILSLTLMVSHSAFADDIHGIFMVVKGDIKITGKEGKTEAAKVGKKVFPGDTITAAADSRAKVVMSDKNVLNISPDSKIVIEKYENDGKDKKNVELNVLYGKVRASVEQKYDGEKNKFNIKTPSAVAGVRGTDFITGYNASSKVTQIVTFSGVVAVGLPGPNGSIANAVFVRPGQMTSAGAGQAPGQPTAVPKEELNNMNTESTASKGGNDKRGVAAESSSGSTSMASEGDLGPAVAESLLPPDQGKKDDPKPQKRPDVDPIIKQPPQAPLPSKIKAVITVVKPGT